MTNPSEVRWRPWLRTGAALVCAAVIGAGVFAGDADARKRSQPSFFGSTATGDNAEAGKSTGNCCGHGTGRGIPESIAPTGRGQAGEQHGCPV